MGHDRQISVVGLGYVGLPVAVAFGKKAGPVIAFDIDKNRLEELKSGYDRTNEISCEELACANIMFTSDKKDLARANFHIVTVPTPIDRFNAPDLEPLYSASRIIGSIIKDGDIVVYESTVYPGATEQDCVPILETCSGLSLGDGFFVGYSPERINPGDRAHSFESISKIVSGSDKNTLEIVANVYESVINAHIHRAPNIQTAEAAKVIENTQRDLNIALINELAMLFRRLDLDTNDVLDAARTKWNFLPFMPGLVGGHCIGVDPYYLTHKAEEVGYTPEIILAGRRINDGLSSYIAHDLVSQLRKKYESEDEYIISILGITFKENVPDVRNSKIVNLMLELKKLGMKVQISDPRADSSLVAKEMHVELLNIDILTPAHAVIFAVAHNEFIMGGWQMVCNLLIDGEGIVYDIKGSLNRDLIPDGVFLMRL